MSLSMRALTSRKVTNKDVQLHNRLAQFTVAPTQYDVNVVQDLYVGRNTSLNKLTVRGDLTVGGDTMVQGLDVSQNLVVAGDTMVQGLDVSQNLVVAGNTILQGLDVSQNLVVAGNTTCNGTIYAMRYLPGQIVNVSMLSKIELNQNASSIVAKATTSIFSYSYVPKIANSYIIIEYQTIYSLIGSNLDEIYAYLYADNTDNRIGITYQKWINGSGGGTRSGTIFPIVGRYTNTDKTAKTIRVDVFNNTDTDTINVNSDNSTWLKITEIGR
jgi:cytoskeletal protein CcmA (bactofilin family)